MKHSDARILSGVGHRGASLCSMIALSDHATVMASPSAEGRYGSTAETSILAKSIRHRSGDNEWPLLMKARIAREINGR
jgi:hypothetical protein